MNRAGLGIAAALAAAAMYGFMPNLAGFGYRNGVPAVEATFYRTSLIGVVLTALAIGWGRNFAIPRRLWGAFAAMMASTFVISAAYLSAAQYIPVGLSVIVFFTFPVIIMLSAPLLEGHSPGLVPIILALVAFAGLGLAIGADFSGLNPLGLLLAACAALGAVVQFYSGRMLGSALHPLVTGGLVHLAIWPLTLGLVLWYNGGVVSSFPGGSTTATGYIAIAAVSSLYVVAFFVQMTSLRLAPASTVAPFYNLEPIVTAAVATQLLGERLDFYQYLGGGIVLAALIAASLYDLRQSRQS